MIRMQRLKGRKTKLALALVASVGIVGILLFSMSNINITRNPLTDAIESGEMIFSAVDRNHESIIKLANELPTEAQDLFKTAQVSQEQAKTSLTYARRTDDEFVLNMAQNYGYLLESSYTMNQGIDNLFKIKDDLENALNYYSNKSYTLAADAASLCLQTLEPLFADFSLKNQSLENINYRYLASGQKDQVKYATVEYRDSMMIYAQYIQLLKTIKQGVTYKQKMDQINNLFNQMQSDVAAGASDDAQKLLNRMSDLLNSLRDPEFQKAAALASQLNPQKLGGKTQSTAQDLRNQLKDLPGLDSLQNYFKAAEQYMKASKYLANGELKEAEAAADKGLSMLAQGKSQSGQGGDVSRYSQALEFAINSLKMQIKGQPDQS